MKDLKFRKALDAYADDHEQDIKVLDDHAYDKSVVGITDDGRLVYDYNKMIEEFMEDEGCDEIEATEWLDYNTMRALPYFGENAPIIINTNRETLMELYGED